jgi:peptidoglycan/LPS O-acetylase OafA/YrhL
MHVHASRGIPPPSLRAWFLELTPWKITVLSLCRPYDARTKAFSATSARDRSATMTRQLSSSSSKSAAPPLQPNVFGTFGVYRFILASMVVFAHTTAWRWMYPGMYAVFAFFILSGYVVSYILHNKYLQSPYGLWKYAINRALRIFPLYWVTLGVSTWLIVAYPAMCEDINPAMVYPHGISLWLRNAFALFLTHPVTGNLAASMVVPVGWSLGIELFYWALLPITLIRPAARTALGWFSIVYTVGIVALFFGYSGASSLPLRFNNLLAGSLPFWVGSLIYLRKPDRHLRVSHGWGIAAMGLFLFFLVVPAFFHDPYFWFFYAFMASNIAMVAYLSRIARSSLWPSFQFLDKYAGDLTYPLYLIHIPVAILVHVAIPSLPVTNYGFFFGVLTISTLLSLLLHYCVERPIEWIKHRIEVGNSLPVVCAVGHLRFPRQLSLLPAQDSASPTNLSSPDNDISLKRPSI